MSDFDHLETDLRTAEDHHHSDEGLMTNPAEIIRFMMAGKSRFTLVSLKTEQRFTYRVTKSEGDNPVYFVSLLTGQDNTSSFSYFGYIKRGIFYHGGQKARVGADAPSVKAFSWAYQGFISGTVKEQLQFWHEGRCGRCGRALTVPESVRTGFGPECAGLVA
jgi:hypothetical protein